MKVTREPYFINLMNEIGCPFDVDVSLTITLAAAPIIVKFPPRHAPNDNAHHKG